MVLNFLVSLISSDVVEKNNVDDGFEVLLRTNCRKEERVKDAIAAIVYKCCFCLYNKWSGDIPTRQVSFFGEKDECGKEKKSFEGLDSVLIAS
ncbi:predicted protein [Chaetoceros tenuissimus]|uniref:Uncharacterized protein n=1 Tax=Chaetoceros tenuissimus TaxID=426638 RepID=A0AAD3H8F6_9STRA|nr:predicted protein [Chaetoceros tenuissimus]